MFNTALAINEVSQEISHIPAISYLSDEFLESQDVRPASRELYKRTLRQYFKWLDNEDIHLETVTRAEIIRYKHHLLNSGLSELTAGSYITVVRKFYEWTEANKYYPNVANGIKNPKRYQGYKKDPLTIEQVKDLLGSFDTSSIQGKRDYAIVNLMVRTGLRTIEVSRANAEDINYKSGKMVLNVQRKGTDSKDNFVVLTRKAYLPIANYLESRGMTEQNEPLFIAHGNRSQGQRLSTRTISKVAKNTIKSIGLNSKRLTAHSLRHTAGVNVLRAGGDLYTTQLFMGHVNPATTQIYLRSIEDEHRLKNAPEELLDSVY